jgi:hypothetical protein
MIGGRGRERERDPDGRAQKKTLRRCNSSL